MRLAPASARSAAGGALGGVASRASHGVPAAWVTSTAIGVCLLWSYWAAVEDLVAYWWRNQDYSVGMLVPPTALYLIWRDRRRLAECVAGPAWWGLGLLVVAEIVRFAGVYFGVGSAARYALPAAVAGTTALLAGSAVFGRLRWVWVFLLLMVPLPARVHEMIAVPLQGLATRSAVFGLELLGYFVVREGNVLRLEGGQAVAVAEACSGLRMLMAFVFVASALAFVVDRPRWQRVILVLASVPIAVLSNSIRVVVTSLFVYYSGSAALTKGFHDAAGLAMMPLAIAGSFALLKFLQMVSAGPPRMPHPG